MKCMKNRIFLILLCCILICPIIFNSSNGMVAHKHTVTIEEETINDDILDIKIRSFMIASYIPSVTACIIKQDTVVWSEEYGYYDFTQFKTPTQDTIYQVASVSKSVTATAILQLYEKGLFDLDEDVNNYLPFNLRNPTYPEIPITFRMLLSHHSSLHDHDQESAYVYFMGDYQFSYLKDILSPEGTDYHPELWGTNKPGSSGNYSNMGFTILGYLVELLSNQSFESYCQENIFQPLGMDHTSFNLNSLPEENLACSYLRIGRIYLKLPNIDYTFLDPCGGLCTTTKDLSKFLIAHMNNGIYKNIRILKEDTVHMMHTIQYPDSEPYYGILYFGLGWLIFNEEFGYNTHGHDGDLTFSHARMRILDDEKTAILYMFNKGLRPSLLPRIIPNILEHQGDVFIRKSLYEKAQSYR